jgi:hypothetical protein
MLTMLLGGGVGAGVVASSVTSTSLRWQPPSSIPMTERALSEPVDQGNAGRSWARTAFEGGLRRCPEMNAEFLAACAAEMKALMEKPKFADGSYGGPLLVTKVAPAAAVEPYRPETPDYDVPPAPEPAGEPAMIDAPTEPTPANYPAEQ